MYSFQPTPDVTASPMAFMFWLIAYLAVIVMLFLSDDCDFFPCKFIIILFFSGLLFISYKVCYSETKYANTPVVGELVGLFGETKMERCGKQNCEKHYTYVVYKMPEGKVYMNGSTGIVYPERAVLYKN